MYVTAFSQEHPQRIRVDFKYPNKIKEVPRVIAAVRLASNADTQVMHTYIYMYI